MTKHFLRGHEIECLDDGQWVFSDTKAPTVQTYKDRPCGYCGKDNTPEDHDGCLGTLPDVMNACCGHGQVKDAYVQFMDASVLSGDEAIAYFKSAKPLAGEVR